MAQIGPGISREVPKPFSWDFVPCRFASKRHEHERTSGYVPLGHTVRAAEQQVFSSAGGGSAQRESCVVRGDVMSQQVQPEQAGRRLGGGAIASVAGLAVLLIFVIQNRQDVRFHFLTVSFIWPLWLYTIVMAAVGALVWFGLGVMRRHRRRKERRENRRH
ncbi:MAG TPA: LapA family protein [Streptosporangiaceae bacterium]|nr:LapA family protein [Streptosporangiaceae bacterium]